MTSQSVDTVEYRTIHSASEFDLAVNLEIEVWGLDPIDAVPTNIMHTIAMNGGVVIGAYIGEQLVGMSLALPLFCEGEWVLWSHMVGVHPEYRGQGIGFNLKQAQRRWALNHGYETMRWTFDPLQRGNANFNIRHLGAYSRKYHINLYGDMTDDINAGLPSDRLEVVWSLNDPKVQDLANQSSILVRSIDQFLLQPSLFILSLSDDLTPMCSDIRDVNMCAVEIPYNLAALKKDRPEKAQEWRLALRETLLLAFTEGYTITEFVNCETQCWYVLTK